ncbi:uncharacterized protein BKA55DRAFT_744814 [Fusarium redolens]|uniref:Uncharacterized protein n=1 Tax=Fusarium redolens TaxID=48865 RepID=A0A9P9JJT0_FUSRE|nr:uncharacterized protein BKA55DRAFT_744814 [Fusarium redolens]KAH7202895.1 hypothetical protein BKA55DRAFT_744814 [Fusarium redolens]
MKALFTLVFAGLTSLVSGRVGDWCSGTKPADQCLCLKHDICDDIFGKKIHHYSDGRFPCPDDKAYIWGCYLWGTWRCMAIAN